METAARRLGWALSDIIAIANWGNPGWAVDYDDAGFIGGALVGKKFEVGNVPLRIEIDGTFGGLSATSNRLDPEGLDETVKSEFQVDCNGARWDRAGRRPGDRISLRRAGGRVDRQFGDRHRFWPGHAVADRP